MDVQPPTNHSERQPVAVSCGGYIDEGGPRPHSHYCLMPLEVREAPEVPGLHDGAASEPCYCRAAGLLHAWGLLLLPFHSSYMVVCCQVS